MRLSSRLSSVVLVSILGAAMVGAGGGRALAGGGYEHETQRGPVRGAYQRDVRAPRYRMMPRMYRPQFRPFDHFATGAVVTGVTLAALKLAGGVAITAPFWPFVITGAAIGGA